jgi:ketosteroid isomerase-like protein
MLAIPRFHLSWQITKVEVSRSGDLAYVQSIYQAALEDIKGQQATERGKVVTVWKKQGDGTWKAVADISNTDSPPPIHKPSQAH